MQIDNSLNWKEHNEVTSSKVSKAVGYLRHAKLLLPEETLKTLYTGIIEPHFCYCCLISLSRGRGLLPFLNVIYSLGCFE